MHLTGACHLGSPGFSVAPGSGLRTTESGGTDWFSTALDSAPTADVIVRVASSDPSEGIVSPSTLIFTPANWDRAQRVTVTGADDVENDGPVEFTIIAGPAVSEDPVYNGLDPADVSVINWDDDVATAPGITMTPTDGLTTNEGATSAAFTVVLNTRPTADVTIGLASSDTSEGTLQRSQCLFTPRNWFLPQMVTVQGVDDAVNDGDQPLTIVTAPAVSSDAAYAGLDAPDVTVTSLDKQVAGVLVWPLQLETSENGTSASLQVVLTTPPLGNVTIPLLSSDTTEATISAGSLTFTPDDWNIPRTVAVTGVNDNLDDGDVTFAITLRLVSSGDSYFNNLDPLDVMVTNRDNDAALVSVTAPAKLITNEVGTTETFTVGLGQQPTADVTVDLSSGDPSEGNVSPASVIFTPANWNIAQTATITGVDDALDDGNVTYSVVIGPAASGDPSFDGFDAPDLTVLNADEDAFTIRTTPRFGLVTTESGGTDSFTVVLTAEPEVDVTVDLTSSNVTEGTVSPAALTFTPADWNVPQTVTVTGVDDGSADGTVGYEIAINSTVVSSQHVLVRNVDDDTAGITVTPLDGFQTSEAGGNTAFSVVLVRAPTADVSIDVASSDAAEAATSVANLTFTPADWHVPQIVTVTGVDDLRRDGDVAFTFVTAPAVSADPAYHDRDAADVALVNVDNETGGVTIEPTGGLVTTETGRAAAFTVVLDAAPAVDVTIGLVSSHPTEGTVSPAGVTFTPADWNAPQTVTVTGLDEPDLDGDVAYWVVTDAIASSDPDYEGLDPADVLLVNFDDETPNFQLSPVSGLITTEAGGTAWFSVVMTRPPAADVTIDLSSSDLDEGTVSPDSVSFTPADWDRSQWVTITGEDDPRDDGNQPYTIVTAPAVSDDAYFHGSDPEDVSVTNTDDDTADILLDPLTLVTTKGGDTVTLAIVLGSEPAADVRIDLSSSDLTEGLGSPAGLVFTPLNWSTPQTITVTGVDDAVHDGPVAFTIVTAAAVSSDPQYGGRDAADVSVTNLDDDPGPTPGIGVWPASGLATTEAGGSVTFLVTLETPPTAQVDIHLASNDASEGAVVSGWLSFSPESWLVPQSVTVQGVDDQIDDGDVVYQIVADSVTSGDPAYDGAQGWQVPVTNEDDDAAGIRLEPATGVSTSEWGGQNWLAIWLETEPTADVTIPISSSDPTEGTVSPESVTFTPGDWNRPQNVIVTGVDDAVYDGNVEYLLRTGPAVSDDPAYQGRTGGDVSVTNADNDPPDVAGIAVTPVGVAVSEDGTTAAYSLALLTVSVGLVEVTVTADEQAQISLDGATFAGSVTFTRGDQTPQTITVRAIDDALLEGPHSSTISQAITGAVVDPTYPTTLAIDSVTADIGDYEPLTVSIPVAAIWERNGTTPATVSRTDTRGEWIVTLVSGDPGEATVPGSVTILADQASAMFTIQAVNDGVVDGTQTVTIVASAAGYVDGQASVEVLESQIWQNPVNRFDVNGDLLVTPLDVLTLINDLNLRDARPLPPVQPLVPPPYLDVSGDGHVSPRDVLDVIDYLNGTGAAEGEADLRQATAIGMPRAPLTRTATAEAHRVRPFDELDDVLARVGRRRRGQPPHDLVFAQLAEATSDELLG